MTLYDPKNYTRPFLVQKALGEQNVTAKYIGGAHGSSRIRFEPVRKITRFIKMYSALNFGNVAGVICLNPYPLGKILNYSFFRKRPFIVDSMDITLNENLELVESEKEILEKANGVIFWSKAFMELLSNKLDVPEKTYIPSGADLSIFEKLAALPKPEVNKQSNRDMVITYFGYFWRINDKDVQGIYDLVKAMAIVEREIRNVQLVLNGVIPDKELLDVIKKTGIKKLTFSAPTPYGSSEFLSRLDSSDVLVLPTSAHPTVFYAEQHKLFIYMATKKPIVATDIPGTRGVLDDTTAVFARTEDSESLASALVRGSKVTRS